MFALKTQRLRRRLSVPTSGSRKRARDLQKAQHSRAEGERIARERREQRRLEKIDQQRKAREELAAYEPWGRAGGGAPNPHGFRFTDLRARGIYPEDELKGVAGYEEWRRWSSPKRHRPRTPLRLCEDPQLFFAEQLRRAVDNDIRYKQTTEQKKTYKEILDDMVDKRNKAVKDEIKQNLEYERKLHSMDSPWGKPGPGGKMWRNPRNIGMDFSKSMGWTNNEIFNKLRGEQKRYKRSSLALPEIKGDDDLKNQEVSDKENNKTIRMEKLPNIVNHSNLYINSKDDSFGHYPRGEVKSKSPKKSKVVKRQCNEERVPKTGIDENVHDVDLSNVIDKKLTPEGSILRLTGGVELVPLLARRRRIGARTLPSSDVTRPPEQACQWREMLDVDYLKQLKHQMREKNEQKEENRRVSAESVRVHHATWSSIWGRPGHGAPQQRGRYARNNLTQLLFVSPVT
ncbi:uncharacterized protein [Battus philenor]|uniref:uncharacterized protein n=1 Tax=Battus philenor TaxID=42288 RepID=UPI0035CF896B